MDEDQAFQKVLRKVRTGFADNANKKVGYAIDKITFPANVRHSTTRDGAITVVHDVPITKVGVQPYLGEDGKIEYHFKTPEAVSGIRSDFSPISISHPEEHFRKMDDEEIKNTMLGWTSDGYYDEKTQKKYSDVYIINARAKESDEGRELLSRIEKGKSTDVSIGFYAEFARQGGVHKGKRYDVQQTALDHDHLALLVEEQGRFSFPDGVGMGADGKERQPQGGQKKVGENKDTGNKSDSTAVLTDAIAEAKTKAMDAEKKAADLQKELDAKSKDFAELQKKISDEKAGEHITRVDAFVSRVKDKAVDPKKFDEKGLKEFCAKLDSEQMTFFESFIGDSYVVKDNKLHVRAKTGSGTGDGKSKDYQTMAREAAEKKWKLQNEPAKA